ncbi:MAG: hypothetical protein KIS87_08150 [Phycisphaeraceae bacterium]|nr:hypothetical protein [Phycisphaeraceae bacterium]
MGIFPSQLPAVVSSMLGLGVQSRGLDMREAERQQALEELRQAEAWLADEFSRLRGAGTPASAGSPYGVQGPPDPYRMPTRPETSRDLSPDAGAEMARFLSAPPGIRQQIVSSMQSEAATLSREERQLQRQLESEDRQTQREIEREERRRKYADMDAEIEERAKAREKAALLAYAQGLPDGPYRQAAVAQIELLGRPSETTIRRAYEPAEAGLDMERRSEEFDALVSQMPGLDPAYIPLLRADYLRGEMSVTHWDRAMSGGRLNLSADPELRALRAEYERFRDRLRVEQALLREVDPDQEMSQRLRVRGAQMAMDQARQAEIGYLRSLANRGGAGSPAAAPGEPIEPEEQAAPRAREQIDQRDTLGAGREQLDAARPEAAGEGRPPGLVSRVVMVTLPDGSRASARRPGSDEEAAREALRALATHCRTIPRPSRSSSPSRQLLLED